MSLDGKRKQNTYKAVLRLDGSDNQVMSTSEGTANYIEDGMGQTSALSINSTRVGIGTTSPTAKLDVVGKISLQDAGNSVFVGYQAGLNDDASVNQNVGVGYQALFSNITGSQNTAHGYKALYSNTTGAANTANGLYALYSNTTGGYNTAYGKDALQSNTTGSSNVANGYQALNTNSTGVFNTAVGKDALRENTTGYSNAAVGLSALRFNTTGDNNTAVGRNALNSNTTGSGNIGIGGVNSTGSIAPVFVVTTENNRIVMVSPIR